MRRQQNMEELFPFRELEAKSLPMVDESVYPPITQPMRSNLDLPFRKLFNIEILDSTGRTHPSLDRLKFDGPFMVKGWVPIEETILRKGQTGRSLVYVVAKRIVEWTHEFNPQNIMQPIFWVNSENVCWYQVQSFSSVYTPIMAPLSDVCAYLDAIIQVIFVDKRVGNQNFVLPLAAKKLQMSVDLVREKVRQYRSQLIDLCSNDPELNHLQIYREWIAEQKQEGESHTSRNAATTTALMARSGRSGARSPSSVTSLSRSRKTTTTRTPSSRTTLTRKSRSVEATAPVPSPTPDPASHLISGANTDEEVQVVDPSYSPGSSLLAVQLQNLSVMTTSTAIKRQRSRSRAHTADSEESRQSIALQRPRKQAPSPLDNDDVSIVSESDSSLEILMDTDTFAPSAHPMDGDVSGADNDTFESDHEMFLTDHFSPSTSENKEEEEEDAAAFQPFGQSGAPCPYGTASGCKDHPAPMAKISRERSREMRDLVISRFIVDPSISHVRPDTFRCPWENCLCVVPNSLYPSLAKFIHVVLDHILRHDLTNNKGFMIVKAYLLTPTREQGHQLALPAQTITPVSGDRAARLNMDLYWLLESGKLSSELNQGRRYQPRTKLSGPASAIRKGRS